ncbi:uncharacterized protein LOC115882312 [Sitophilus oryzae]|uniref:Uncharacterized protein LOC115882312 n=1 Tax=Sitophilus oryzae TaxID=7048 RepID=A0A6J2XXH4_SITOR|nr:uncharacterized protein LOC115882312 [Sitophilus oryzae]
MTNTRVNMAITRGLYVFLTIIFLCINIVQMFTTITSKNYPIKGSIVVKEVKKPHHLFIGRCPKNVPMLHQENIILKNDNQTLISANIKVIVEGRVNITCVNIYDEDPEVQAYPSYISGGIGYNFIEFHVVTSYGNGFKFYVEIFGYQI